MGRFSIRSSVSAQLYFRIDPEGIFTGALPTSGYTSTFVPLYAFLHPNAAPTITTISQLKYVYLDIATGKIYNPSSGASNNNLVWATTNQQTAIVFFGEADNTLRTFTATAAGKTQRVHMVHKGIAYLTEMTSVSSSDGKHVVAKNGVRYDVGPVGVPFYNKGYPPDIQPAREPHVGNRLYRCYNNGTAYNSGGKLDRVDYPNGIENGGAIVTNKITAGVTPGVAANDAVLRYFPVKGAAETGVVGYALVGKYVDFNDWTDNRFIPVFA